MSDYRKKRRYWLEKLTRQALDRNAQRGRYARARYTGIPEAPAGELPIFERVFHPENLIRTFDELKAHAGQAPGPGRAARPDRPAACASAA